MRLADAISSLVTRWGTAAVTAALVLGAGVSPALATPPTSYRLTVTFTQNGSDVDASFSGALDTTSLTPQASDSRASGFTASPFDFVIGGAVYPSTAPVTLYDVANLSGFANLATGSFGATSSSASGDVFGVFTDYDYLLLPTTYTSKSSISGSSVFADETLADMGLTVGITSVSIASDDNIKIVVQSGSPVPEPTSMALLAAGIAGIGAVRRRKRA